MKRLYAAIAFLIIAAGLCVFEQYTVESAYTEATAYINNASAALENNDYTAAEENCKALSEYWNKKYPYMSAMIDHGSLDDAGVTINSLTDLCRNKSDDLQSELIAAKNMIKSIRDHQKITFGNVF